MKIIMKLPVYLTLVLFAAGCANAQTGLPTNEWKAILKVVDETDRPVSRAKVWVAYDNPEDGESTDPFVTNNWAIAGLTDTNGMFMASHRDQSRYLGFHAQKAGHYSTWIQHELGYPFQYDQVKWNPTATLLLKTIRHPIPMYAKSVNLGVPVLDKPAGFDLMAGDWVAPYGKGSNADILFTGHFDKRADDESDFTLTVSFPNSGDGIQEFTLSELEKASGLRSPHESPAGGYKPQWIQTDNRKPGRPIQTNRDEKRNYFFRVRTVLDENGNVKSALYGKIYGDFMQFRYYLNPTPNERNVEFDPKQNLLNGLKSTERVDAP